MNVRELAAAYLLGELDEREAAEFDRRLGSDPALRAEVEAMRSLLAELEQLPGEAWPAPQTPPVPAPEQVGWRRRLRPDFARRRWSVRPGLALGVLLAALLVGGVTGAALDRDGDAGSTPTAAIALQPLDAPAAASGNVTMPSPEEMVLTVADLPPSGRDQYYELWLLDDAGRTVPVASFRVGENGAARVRVPLPADPARYRYFDVSRQHAAQGTEHSADSVLRGPTSPS